MATVCSLIRFAEMLCAQYENWRSKDLPLSMSGPSSSQPANGMLRLRCVRRFNLLLYSVALAAMFIGVGVAFCGAHKVGLHISAGGILLLIPLGIERVFVLPRLKCPRCGKPFFLYQGVLALTQQLPLVNRSCLHCHTRIEGRRARDHDREIAL